MKVRFSVPVDESRVNNRQTPREQFKAMKGKLYLNGKELAPEDIAADEILQSLKAFGDFLMTSLEGLGITVTAESKADLENSLTTAKSTTSSKSSVPILLKGSEKSTGSIESS